MSKSMSGRKPRLEWKLNRAKQASYVKGHFFECHATVEGFWTTRSRKPKQGESGWAEDGAMVSAQLAAEDALEALIAPVAEKLGYVKVNDVLVEMVARIGTINSERLTTVEDVLRVIGDIGEASRKGEQWRTK